MWTRPTTGPARPIVPQDRAPSTPRPRRQQARRTTRKVLAMADAAKYDLNWIVSVDDHVIEPPNVWPDRVPAKYHDVAPRMITEDDGQRGLGLRGQPEHHRRPGRHRRPATGGHHRGGLPLLRDAPGLLRPGGPPARHGRGRHPGLAQLPLDPPLLRPALLGGPGQGPGPPVRQGLQRLDDRRVVRHRPGPASSPSPSSRCGTPRRRSRRSSARRPRAPTPSPSRRTSSPWACPPSTTRAATGTRCCRRPTTPSMVLSIHIGSSSTMYKIATQLAVHGQHVHGLHPAGRRHAGLDLQRACSSASPRSRSPCPRVRIGWIPWFLERAQQVWTPRATGWPRASSSAARLEGGPRHDATASTSEPSMSTGTTGSTSTAASSTTPPGSACSTWWARTT